MAISLGVALAVSAIAAALKGGASAVGSHKASKHNKRTEDLINAEKRQAELDRIKAGNNYLETEEGKTIANQGAEALKNATKSVTKNAIKRGQTTEQKLAEVGQWQDKYNALLTNLASKGTEYRKYYDALLNNARAKYNNNMMTLNGQKAQSVKNSWQNIGGAVGDLAKAGLTYYAMEQSPDIDPSKVAPDDISGEVYNNTDINGTLASYNNYLRRQRWGKMA